MRWTICLAVLVIAGCGQKPQDEQAQSLAVPSGPNVGVTALPGLALTYDYGFRIPADRVAHLQEEHASQCEALKPDRCRIVGMRYSVTPRQGIDASLSLKLAPEAARSFGKQAVDTTVKRGGMLTDAAIDSVEAGVAKAAQDKEAADLSGERARLDKELSRANLSAQERTELQAQRLALSDDRRAARAESEASALLLASTPMTLRYSSGAVDNSLADGPILGALKDGWSNVIPGFATIITILLTLLPWILTLAMIVLGWRWLVRRLASRDDGTI